MDGIRSMLGCYDVPYSYVNQNDQNDLNEIMRAMGAMFTENPHRSSNSSPSTSSGCFSSKPQHSSSNYSSPKPQVSSPKSDESIEMMNRLNQLEKELTLLKYERIKNAKSCKLDRGEVKLQFKDDTLSTLSEQGWKCYSGSSPVYIVTTDNRVYLLNPNSGRFERLTLDQEVAVEMSNQSNV